jgi:hypothetical protein
MFDGEIDAAYETACKPFEESHKVADAARHSRHGKKGKAVDEETTFVPEQCVSDVESMQTAEAICGSVKRMFKSYSDKGPKKGTGVALDADVGSGVALDADDVVSLHLDAAYGRPSRSTKKNTDVADTSGNVDKTRLDPETNEPHIDKDALFATGGSGPSILQAQRAELALAQKKHPQLKKIAAVAAPDLRQLGGGGEAKPPPLTLKEVKANPQLVQAKSYLIADGAATTAAFIDSMAVYVEKAPTFVMDSWLQWYQFHMIKRAHTELKTWSSLEKELNSETCSLITVNNAVATALGRSDEERQRVLVKSMEHGCVQYVWQQIAGLQLGHGEIDMPDLPPMVAQALGYLSSSGNGKFPSIRVPILNIKAVCDCRSEAPDHVKTNSQLRQAVVWIASDMKSGDELALTATFEEKRAEHIRGWIHNVAVSPLAQGQAFMQLVSRFKALAFNIEMAEGIMERLGGLIVANDHLQIRVELSTLQRKCNITPGHEAPEIVNKAFAALETSKGLIELDMERGIAANNTVYVLEQLAKYFDLSDKQHSDAWKAIANASFAANAAKLHTSMDFYDSFDAVVGPLNELHAKGSAFVEATKALPAVASTSTSRLPSRVENTTTMLHSIRAEVHTSFGALVDRARSPRQRRRGSPCDAGLSGVALDPSLGPAADAASYADIKSWADQLEAIAKADITKTDLFPSERLDELTRTQLDSSIVLQNYSLCHASAAITFGELDFAGKQLAAVELGRLSTPVGMKIATDAIVAARAQIYEAALLQVDLYFPERTAAAMEPLTAEDKDDNSGVPQMPTMSETDAARITEAIKAYEKLCPPATDISGAASTAKSDVMHSQIQAKMRLCIGSIRDHIIDRTTEWWVALDGWGSNELLGALQVFNMRSHTFCVAWVAAWDKNKDNVRAGTEWLKELGVVAANANLLCPGDETENYIQSIAPEMAKTLRRAAGSFPAVELVSRFLNEATPSKSLVTMMRGMFTDHISIDATKVVATKDEPFLTRFVAWCLLARCFYFLSARGEPGPAQGPKPESSQRGPCRPPSRGASGCLAATRPSGCERVRFVLGRT